MLKCGWSASLSHRPPDFLDLLLEECCGCVSRTMVEPREYRINKIVDCSFSYLNFEFSFEAGDVIASERSAWKMMTDLFFLHLKNWCDCCMPRQFILFQSTTLIWCCCNIFRSCAAHRHYIWVEFELGIKSRCSKNGRKVYISVFFLLPLQILDSNRIYSPVSKFNADIWEIYCLGPLTRTLSTNSSCYRWKL